jgi:hypothetical protein
MPKECTVIPVCVMLLCIACAFVCIYLYFCSRPVYLIHWAEHHRIVLAQNQNATLQMMCAHPCKKNALTWFGWDYSAYPHQGTPVHKGDSEVFLSLLLSSANFLCHLHHFFTLLFHLLIGPLCMLNPNMLSPYSSYLSRSWVCHVCLCLLQLFSL